MNRGWKQTTIAEAAAFTPKPRGLNYATFERIPFVPMELTPTDSTYIQSFSWRAGNQIRSGNYFEKGDCLLAKITPCFENGKQGIIRELPGDFGVASTELIPFRGRKGISNKYFLFYYFLEPTTRRQIAQKMEGATGRQRIPISVLKNWPIVLPPLPEQKKIAGVLLKIQRAIETQEKIIRSLRDLKKSTMHHLFTKGFSGEKTKMTEIGEIPESWRVVPLGAMGRIGNGSTPKRTNHAYWDEGTIPWLTSGKIHEGTVKQADQFVTRKAVEECHLPTVRSGGLVIAITGQGKTLGHTALITFETTMSQHLAYIQPENPRLHPPFVYQFLKTRYADLRRIGFGGGSTKGALTCASLRDYPISQPETVEEQRKITSILEKMDGKEHFHESKKMVLQELFKTSLNRLMTGGVRVTNLDIDISEVGA
jgi:type I restriction enzyme S subunit